MSVLPPLDRSRPDTCEPVAGSSGPAGAIEFWRRTALKLQPGRVFSNFPAFPFCRCERNRCHRCGGRDGIVASYFFMKQRMFVPTPRCAGFAQSDADKLPVSEFCRSFSGVLASRFRVSPSPPSAGSFAGSRNLVLHNSLMPRHRSWRRGSDRTRSGNFFKIHHSAITTLPPEANSLLLYRAPVNHAVLSTGASLVRYWPTHQSTRGPRYSLLRLFESGSCFPRIQSSESISPF